MDRLFDFFTSKYDKEELISKVEALGDDMLPIVYSDNEDGKNMYIGKDKITDVYNSKAGDDWTTTDVGGMKSGLKKSDLAKYSTSEILDMILFKVVQPTKSSSNSISLSYSGSTLLTVGDTLPTESDFSVSVNKGSWSDGTSYAGNYTSTVTMSPNMFGQVSEEGKYTVTLTTVFEAGDTPKDNRGNTAEVTPYSGGTLTKTVTLTSVYPVYINNVDIETKTSHIYNYYSGVSEIINIPSEKEGDTTKFSIWIPSDVTLTIYSENPITHIYDVPVNMVLLQTYTENGTEYKEYIRTTDYYSVNTDSVNYKIELKKN